MSYADQFQSYKGPKELSTLQQLEYEETQYAPERGTTVDILRDIYVGSGRALKLFGEGTGMEKATKAGEGILNTEFAKPDKSQYYGYQGRAGRVTDMIFESLPTSLAIGGTAVGGALVGGPVGGYAAGAAALGILGSGVYHQSYKEISEARPDLDEDSKFKYGMVNALLEVGSEAIPFAGHLVGKAISAPAKKAALNALLDSKVVNADDLIGASLKSVDHKKLVAGLFGSAVADGASEVVNELGQAANKESYGLSAEPVDLIDVFLAGMAPSAAVTGGTVALDSRARSIVKGNVQKGLTSEDLGAREHMQSQVSQGLAKVHPELQTLWDSKVGPLVQQGPVDLKTALGEGTQEDVLTKITETPEKIINEKLYGPMKTKKNGQEKGLTDLEVQAQRTIDYRNAHTSETPEIPGIEQELQQRAAREAEVEQLRKDQEAFEKGDAVRVDLSTVSRDTSGRISDDVLEQMRTELRMDSAMKEIKDGNSVISSAPVETKKVETEERRLHDLKNTVLVEDYMRATAPAAGRIEDSEVESMYHALRYETLDKGRKKAIEDGMARVIADSNTLSATADLEERATLKQQIAKTNKLLKEEIQEVQKEAPKPKKAPESPKVERKVEPKVVEGEDLIDALGGGRGYPVVDNTKLDVKEATLAQDLVSKGVKPEHAMVLAKKGITDVSKPVEVSSGLYTNGERIEKGNRTTGKAWKVVGKDGVERRAASKAEAERAIQEGTVHKLELFEGDGSRTSKNKRELPKLTEEHKAAVETFLKSNPVSKISSGIFKTQEASEEISSLAHEAVVRVAAEGKPLDLPVVREKLRSLSKSVENSSDKQKMQRAGLKGETVSAESLFAKEEAEIQKEESEWEPEDVEGATLEDTEDSNESGEEKEGDTPKATSKAVLLKTDAGINNLQKVALRKEPDGTKKTITMEQAKKLPKDQIEYTDRTPDGKYSVEVKKDKGADGVTRISLEVKKDTGESLGTVNDLKEAEERIKEDRKSEAPEKVEKVEPVRKIVRRRQKEDAELMSEDAIIADMFLESRGNPQLAKVALLDSRIENKEGALAIINAMLEEKLADAKALQSRFPNGHAVMEHIAKNSPAPYRQLASVLMKTVSRDKLEGISVVLGERNYYRNGIIFLRKDAGAGSQLHELVHAITSRELDSNEGLRKEVEAMRGKALSHAVKEGYLTPAMAKRLSTLKTSREFMESPDWGIQREIAYGLLNNKEFLSQAFSSHKFQMFLQEQKGEGKRSLLGRLWDSVRKLLGIKGEVTLLDDVLAIVPEISLTEIKEYSEAHEYDELPPSADAATAIIMKGKGSMASWKENLQKHGSNLKTFAENIARPISDIILAIDKKMWGALMRYETDIQLNNTEYGREVKPFMEYLKTLTQSQRVRLSYALLNAHLEENQKVVREMVPKKIWESVEGMLGKLKKRAIETGELTEEDAKGFYFPRRVTDIKGLMQELHKDDPEGGLLGVAFRAEANRLGIAELTMDQKVQVMTDMFHTGHFRNLPRPGGVKHRSVPHVEPETYKYYADPADALIGHIHEMNEKIGAREFIGDSSRKRKLKELKKAFDVIEGMEDGEERQRLILEYDAKAKQLEDLEAELSSGIAGLVVSTMGTKSWDDQQKVISLINARIRQRGASGVSDLGRNIIYISTMGNFISAITQLADIPTIFHQHGVNTETWKGVKDAFGNIGKIMRNEFTGGKVAHTGSLVEEVDFTRHLMEFSNGNTSAKWVEAAFKYSGLKFTDLIGKEAFMQGSWNHWRNPKNKDAFMKKFEPFLGKDLQATYDDLQAGKRSRDVMAVLIAELAGYQPITLSQQSKAYLEGGNLRVFYTLKTFTLRATSRIIMEATERFKKASVEFEKGNKVEGTKLIAEGVRRATALLMLYAAAGAGAEELKDLLRGREVDFMDNVYDNILKLFFVSKYSASSGYQKDALVKTIMSDLLPPMRWMDNFVADVGAVVGDDKEFKFKSLQMVPLVGTIGYAQSPAGQASFHSREKESILEIIRENKKNGRPAYHGGVSQKIAEYNRKVQEKDEKISNDSVQKTYKRN